MSNLVEIAKDLEYVPDEQLIQLANGSDPRFPPFVVISEIKRRTDMRSRSSEPMPKTTVAQEMVQEFAMPSRQGLEGMSQDATGILPPTVYNRDMPSSMMADGGLVGYADKGQTETTGSKIKRFLTAPIRAISDLGRLQYEASEDAKNRLKEKNSTNADRRNDLITKSLPVIKGEKTLQEFRKEMEELFNSDFIKDDKNYRNQIRNYYFQFEKEFLPRFQKEIAETGEMPKDVISHYNKYENFRNSNRYLNPFDTGYERPDLSLPEQMQKKQEGGLVGYAGGDEIKYRNKIEELAGAKLGPSNPKSLSESILERYKKSQQRGRFINDPNNPLNKIFRYIPDAQQVSNFLQGKRGEDFTPDVRRATDKSMDKKQEGGLTGYQTGNQTALTNTFIYGDNYANNLADYLDMIRKTRTMDQREQALLGSNNLSYPMLSTTPNFNMDMSGISALTPTQIDLDSQLVMQQADETKLSESKTLNYLEKQLEEAKENLRIQKERGDRGVLGGGTSYIDQAQARVDRLQNQINPRKNKKNFVVDTQNLLRENLGQETEALATAIKVQEDKEKADAEEAARLAAEEAEKKKFANMDVDIPERTQRPRTEAEMKQQLNADVLMTVGTAIGSSATPSELFQKLSGLPAQLASSRKEQRKEVRDFESDRRADALAKLNIQIALKKIDQAQEQARLKGNANDVAAINALSDVLQNTTPDSARYKAAESALDSIIARLTGGNTNTQGIAALSELLIPAES